MKQGAGKKVQPHPPTRQPIQQSRQMPTQPKTFERPKSSRPANGIERDQTANLLEGNDLDTTDEDNEEWLKPKIFKPRGPGTGEMS
jgi:hypothetical protein